MCWGPQGGRGTGTLGADVEPGEVHTWSQRGDRGGAHVEPNVELGEVC